MQKGKVDVKWIGCRRRRGNVERKKGPKRLMQKGDRIQNGNRDIKQEGVFIYRGDVERGNEEVEEEGGLAQSRGRGDVEEEEGGGYMARKGGLQKGKRRGVMRGREEVEEEEKGGGVMREREEVEG